MKNLLIMCIFSSCVVLFVHGTTENNTNLENMLQTRGNLTLLQKWQSFEISAKKGVNKILKIVLSRVMEIEGNLSLSSQCIKQGMHLIDGIRNIKPWAIRFIDSSAKVIDGLFVGTMSSFGSYDECVDTEVTSERGRDTGRVLYRGQYCTLDIVPPLPPKKSFYKLDEVLDELKDFAENGSVISLAAKSAHFFHFLKMRLGICVPSGCSADDINQIVNQIGNSISLSIEASRCEIKKEIRFTSTQILVMFAYSFAGFFMLIGSIIDIWAYYSKKTFKGIGIRYLQAFSFIRNYKKFSSTKKSFDTLNCLDGIRFLGMTWIVLGHTYLNVNFQMFSGLLKTTEYSKDFAFQAVINATVAVDTFFCMGGLLACYLTVKNAQSNGHYFSVKYYIFHRLWRILPVYLYVLLFTFLSDLLGYGPLWYDTTNKYTVDCQENWWINLLFINNFYKSENMCLPHSWYLACDFQMYIAALLILIPLIRRPKLGISMCVAAIIASVTYSGVGTYVNGYPPALLSAHPDLEQRNTYLAYFYFRPFLHAGAYCIGLLAGYILATKPDLKMSKGVLLAGWSAAFVCTFSVLYGVFEWNCGAEPTLVGGLLYAAFNRTVWSLGVAWMMVCCATGHGGVINYVLSMKVFVPLGRLTFIVYLIHPFVQMAVVGNIRTQIQADHFFIVWLFFGHLCVSYSIAFAMNMLVEAPMMSLEKIMFGEKDEKKDVESENNKKDVSNGTFKCEKNGGLAVIVHNGFGEKLETDHTRM